MIHIGVYGTEADLNRELSRRGLIRVAGAGVHVVLYDKGVKTTNCIIHGDYGSPAMAKCRKWFNEGNNFYMNHDRKPREAVGDLEMMSHWGKEDMPYWKPMNVSKAI